MPRVRTEAFEVEPSKRRAPGPSDFRRSTRRRNTRRTDADGAAAGYWRRSAVLVDPDSTKAALAADDGVTRWRNLAALSAALAGQTVTVSCTGSQTLLASNELDRAGAAQPACTVTQLP